MKPKDKIDLSINIICNHHEFFSPAACGVSHNIWGDVAESANKLHPVPSNVPTACIIGDYVYYNPDFVDSLNQQQITGLIIHELLHQLLDHPLRLREQFKMDRRLANVAADYEINNMVTSYNDDVPFPIQLPPEGCVDVAKYGGLSAEVIFKKLLKEQEQEGEQPPQPPQPPTNPSDEGEDDGGNDDDDSNDDGNDDGNDGGNDDGNDGGGGKSKQREPSSCGEFEPEPDTRKARETSDKWREVLASSIQTAKLRGKGGGKFIQKLEEMMESPLDIESMLEKYADEFCMNDDSTKTDRRHLAYHDVCIAGMESDRVGVLVFIKDTSGSMGKQELEASIAVVRRVSERMQPRTIVVIDADAEVCAVEEYQPHDDIPVTCHGRGGTDFRPAFQHVADEYGDARAIVYMTDGDGPFPDEPDIPTLWLSFGLPESDYPFGEVVDMNQLLSER